MNQYEVSSTRRESVREAIDRLSRAERVVLTTHVNPDGDGVGCEAALVSYLEKAGAEVWIVNPTPLSTHLRFLIEDESRVLDAQSDEARERCGEADLCVIVDTSERSRIGRVGALVGHLPTFVIDHHPVGDAGVDGPSLRDVSAAAAGELVFDLLWTAGGPWTASAVNGLYVALMTDTGSFRFSNVTPRVHRIVSELIERGASPDGLFRTVYGKVPLRRIRLLEQVLPTLDVSADGRVAWISIPAQVLADLGCSADDLEGLVDYPRELEGVEVALLFRELEGGQVKVSLRSNGRVDVNSVARSIGGGGHVRASGALLSGSIGEVRKMVIGRVIAACEAADLALSTAGAPEP